MLPVTADVPMCDVRHHYLCETNIFCYCRDVFLEKHWKSVIHRSICDYFFEAQSKVGLVYQLFIKLVFAVGFRLTLTIYFRTVICE